MIALAYIGPGTGGTSGLSIVEPSLALVAIAVVLAVLVPAEVSSERSQ